MDRIINGMDRSLNPESDAGIAQIHEVIKTISNFSTLPFRNDWKNIAHTLQSAKEQLAATAKHLRRHKSNWLSLKNLPAELWLNGGS